MHQHEYDHQQAQAFERLALDAAARLRTSRQLAEEFLDAAQGNPTAAVHIARLYVKALYPAFVTRRCIGSPAEKLYNRITKAVSTQAKTWS
jgi:hypothetical protein